MNEITYRTRDIGYGVEVGSATGTWGARDWTGKREFVPSDGSAWLYLFDDEVDSHMNDQEFAALFCDED